VDNPPLAMEMSALHFLSENMEWLTGLHFRRSFMDWKAWNQKTAGGD
jgi:hypothetical protein